MALFGVAALVLGVAVLYFARRIPTGFGYDVVGPGMFPTIVGIGLAFSGLIAVFEARGSSSRNDVVPIDLFPVALISSALLLESAAIRSLGWIPVTGLLFLAGTWAFGDRRAILNLVIGLLMGTVILVAFDFGLGLDLPLGPLAPLLSPAG
jgi:putative tricarboxylic transport membrane protein